MSNLNDYCARELERAGFKSDELYGGMLFDMIMKMVNVFAEEGHSGMSASITTSALTKLLRWEPLTPLTGADDEWVEVSAGIWQNNRCSRVFKEADGSAYDIEGRVFVEPDGCAFTSRDSRVPIIFPYTPKTERVEVAAPE